MTVVVRVIGPHRIALAAHSRAFDGRTGEAIDELAVKLRWLGDAIVAVAGHSSLFEQGGVDRVRDERTALGLSREVSAFDDLGVKWLDLAERLIGDPRTMTAAMCAALIDERMLEAAAGESRAGRTRCPARVPVCRRARRRPEHSLARRAGVCVPYVRLDRPGRDQLAQADRCLADAGWRARGNAVDSQHGPRRGCWPADRTRRPPSCSTPGSPRSAGLHQLLVLPGGEVEVATEVVRAACDLLADHEYPPGGPAHAVGIQKPAATPRHRPSPSVVEVTRPGDPLLKALPR